MKITYEYPGGQQANFDIQAVLENKEEIILIGLDSSFGADEEPGYRPLGITEDDKENFSVYDIEYQDEEYYKSIIKDKMGKKFELLSDISTVWRGKEFTKIEMTERLKYYLSDENAVFPLFKNFPGGFLQYTGTGCEHKLVTNYKKPTL